MSRHQQRVQDYLLHILKAIERIDSYINGMDKPTFMDNHLVQDAVIRNLEIIGEACNNIEKHSPAFVTNHPELPLSHAYQMRNAIAHGYFKVDFEIVWRTIRCDLPVFHTRIRSSQGSLFDCQDHMERDRRFNLNNSKQAENAKAAPFNIVPLVIDRLEAYKFGQDMDSLGWAKALLETAERNGLPFDEDILRDRAEAADVMDALEEIWDNASPSNSCKP